MSTLIHYLRRTALMSGKVDLTDAQLLECFLYQGEEAAMGALVKRHGPMVWGVCRRVLGNHHDAEDAFQATFLVLVRKASSIFPREKVANWLYGVAMKTARKKRATSARRKSHEKQVLQMPDLEAAPEAALARLEPVLDLELSRLPQKYRCALVLCELEGKTRKQAARELGLPEGTVAGHLARGKTMLARRLCRYGVPISCAQLTMLITEQAAAAEVPRALLLATAKTTTIIAAGKTAVAALAPPSVVALAQGVVKSMLLTKLKTTISAVFLAALLCGGVGSISHQAWAAWQSGSAEPVALAAVGLPEPRDVESLGANVIFPAAGAAQLFTQVPRTQIEHQSQVLSVVWSRDGKLIATGTKDGAVQIFDPVAGKEIRGFAPGEAIPGMALSPDGKLLAIAGAGNTGLSFWETDTGNRMGQAAIRIGGVFQPGSFGFTPDGQTLASIQVGGYSSMRFMAGGIAGGVIAGGVGGGGGGVIIGGQGGGIGAAAGAKGAAGGAAGGGAAAKAVGKAGGGAAGQGGAAGGKGAGGGAAGGQGGGAGGKGAGGGKAAGGAGGGGGGGAKGGVGGKGGGGAFGPVAPGAAVLRPAAQLEGVTAMAADGSAGGSCDTKGQLYVWDAKSNAHTAVMNVGKAHSLAFVSGRTEVAVAGDNGEVQLWDWATKNKVAALTGLQKPASKLVCSSDGSTLAAVTEEKSSIIIWDLARKTVRSKINHSAGPIEAFALSPDGKTIATSVTDGKTLYLRNAMARELTHQGAPIELAANDLATLWNDLGSQDFEQVNQAWQKLGAARDNAIPFFKQQVRQIAVPQADLKSIQKLIADLDSEKFAQREAAVKELAEAGELAILPLQRMLEKPPSPEAATRAELVLKKLAKPEPTPDRRRVSEVIDLLEQLRTDQAIALLQEIEREAQIAQIHTEARQALQRISQSDGKK